MEDESNIYEILQEKATGIISKQDFIDCVRELRFSDCF